jgi:hypothetical protein
MAQSSPQLLQKDGQAFGGAQEEDEIDLGYVDAFAQYIDDEQILQGAATEVRKALA